MISSVFPGEIPGRSRLALLGRRGFPLSGSVTGKADRGLVTKVNLFYNGFGVSLPHRTYLPLALTSAVGRVQMISNSYLSARRTAK